jgi:hypothetical protein
VAKNNEEGRMKMCSRILQAALHLGRHNVSGDTNDEQLSKVSVEDQLGRDTRIAATENGRERLLSPREIGQGLFADRWEGRFALHKAAVAFDQLSQRLFGENI